MFDLFFRHLEYLIFKLGEYMFFLFRNALLFLVKSWLSTVEEARDPSCGLFDGTWGVRGSCRDNGCGRLVDWSY